jgi:hypothetical protein
MLDADNYNHTLIRHQGFNYEFGRASFYHDRIIADVTITPIEEVE